MSVRLLVLGILKKKPVHGYEIQRLLEQSQTAQWARVLPGSVYHALKTMTTEGLVAVEATESAGHRQRAVYAITEPGLRAYTALLRETWARVPDSIPSDLYVALTFWEDLPREEALSAVDAAIAQLHARRQDWSEGERAKARVMELPDWLRGLFQNGRDHLDADIRLLERLRDQMLREPTPASPTRRRKQDPNTR